MRVYTGESLEAVLKLIDRYDRDREIPFAEVEGGLPCDPRGICRRVHSFIESDTDFATLNEIAIARFQQAVRCGIIQDVYAAVVYAAEDGIEYVLDLDKKGDFIQPWPASNLTFDVLNCAFYARFDKEYTK